MDSYSVYAALGVSPKLRDVWDGHKGQSKAVLNNALKGLSQAQNLLISWMIAQRRCSVDFLLNDQVVSIGRSNFMHVPDDATFIGAYDSSNNVRFRPIFRLRRDPQSIFTAPEESTDGLSPKALERLYRYKAKGLLTDVFAQAYPLQLSENKRVFYNGDLMRLSDVDANDVYVGRALSGHMRFKTPRL